jgi:pimeloyl-ACP methyl ester carboxylesterase
MPTLDVDGAVLAWDESGPSSSASSVVLLHGLGARVSDWAFQLPVLAERYRVIAVDLPGHGGSALPRERVTIDDIADRVGALLAHLAAPPVHLVGLSLGGCVALALAVRAPARVRSLTLVNAFARLRPAGPRAALRLLARLALLAVAPMPCVAAHVARGLFPKREQRDLYARAVASLGATSRAGYVAAVRALARFDARPRLAGVRCPTLIVVGDRDATVPRSAAETLCAGIAGARMVVVADSGHATTHDQPETLNRALLAFLQTC